MRSSPLTGILLLLVIIAAVVAWFFVGDPFMHGRTDTTTAGADKEQNEDPAATGQGGPLTPAQLEARVVVDAPERDALVPKTFTVTGTAPGPWFFEASFPIEVRSATGTVLAIAVATALTDWMTTDDVAFKADIDVTGYSGAATLVLRRDNASGLPEHDASVSIPIVVE